MVENMRDHAEVGRGGEARYRLVINGEIRHVHSRSRPVADSLGDVAVMRGTIQDETEMAQQSQALDSANRRLSDLIAMIGHDVRQPLGVVIAYLDEVIEEWDSDDHEQREVHVTKALSAALRTNQMLDDILTMIKPDSGSIAVHPQRKGLAERVAQALAQEHYDVVPSLEVIDDADAEVDPFHVRQILGNLLSNAARYGAPPVTITIEATEDEVTMRVTDSGPGVVEAFVPHMFNRFTRTDVGTTPASASAGFGLYLVRELTHANGGTIEYRPAHPSGAEFCLRFRRATS